MSSSEPAQPSTRPGNPANARVQRRQARREPDLALWRAPGIPPGAQGTEPAPGPSVHSLLGHAPSIGRPARDVRRQPAMECPAETGTRASSTRDAPIIRTEDGTVSDLAGARTAGRAG